jgi:hypothetical protein
MAEVERTLCLIIDIDTEPYHETSGKSVRNR